MVQRKKRRTMGVGGGGCVSQALEEPNIFVASSQRLLNGTRLRFASVNLAL